MFYSPLRYPGGKNKLAKFIAKICVENNINGHYVEPYAGGASVALFLLLKKKVSKITINDYDRSIYAFWFSILKHTDIFCKMIENTEINIETWRKAKAKYKKQIKIFNLDAVDLIEIIKNESQNQQTIFYFDPPYYLKGKSLYINHYKHNDHEKIGKLINSIQNIHWIVSYDNTKEINKIYNWVTDKKKIEYSFFHTAHRAKEGKEILFFSDSLKNIDLVINPVKQKL